MPGSGNTKSDGSGIAIITSPSNGPQSASQPSGRNPQSENPQSAIGESAIRNPQSENPQSASQPTGRNPQSAHFSILQYSQSEEQNVRVKPLPRAFHPQPLNYDHRILVLAFFTGLPGAVVGLILLWKGGFDMKTQWTLTVFIVACWLGCALALRERVVTPLQTLSNLLAALREGGYSIRGRATKKDDPL